MSTSRIGNRLNVYGPRPKFESRSEDHADLLHGYAKQAAARARLGITVDDLTIEVDDSWNYTLPEEFRDNPRGRHQT